MGFTSENRTRTTLESVIAYLGLVANLNEIHVLVKDGDEPRILGRGEPMGFLVLT